MSKNQNRKDAIRAYATLHNVNYTTALRAIDAFTAPAADPLSFTTFLRFQLSPKSVAYQLATARAADSDAAEPSLLESFNVGVLDESFKAFARWVLDNPAFPEFRVFEAFDAHIAAAGLSSEMRMAGGGAWYDYGSWLMTHQTFTADLVTLGRFPTGMDTDALTLRADIRFPNTADYQVALDYLRAGGASAATVDCLNALWVQWVIHQASWTQNTNGSEPEILAGFSSGVWEYEIVAGTPALSALPASTVVARERGYAVYTGSIDSDARDNGRVWSFELVPPTSQATAVFEAELITVSYDTHEFMDAPTLVVGQRLI